MCKYGVRVLPEGWTDHAPSTQMPQQNGNGFGGKPFCYNPLVWGHVNERLPMHLFSHEFVERQAPPYCIVGRARARLRARARVIEERPTLLHAHMHMHMQAPACVMDGEPKRHENMNCSQPTTSPSRALPRSTLASNAAALVVAPQGRPWCKPLDTCGSDTG